MLRLLVRLALLAGLAFLAWKMWQLFQQDDTPDEGWSGADRAWQPPPPAEARTATKAVATKAAAEPAWVKPIGSTCPPGHPVKAKMGSKVFRVPGMFSYEASKPDRCYCNEERAVADGFTRAKR